jgi:hypothetical protein
MTTIETTNEALRKLAGQQVASEMQGAGFLRPSVKTLRWAKSNCIERLRLGDRAAIRSLGIFSFAVADELGISYAAARRWLKKAEAEGLAISSPTLGGCTRWWPVGLAAQLLALFEPAFDSCRICGCTDTQACPGGCYWVEPNLCSACAEAPLPFGDAP